MHRLMVLRRTNFRLLGEALLLLQRRGRRIALASSRTPGLLFIRGSYRLLVLSRTISLPGERVPLLR